MNSFIITLLPTLYILFIVTLSSATIPTAELNALEDFYNDCNGENWILSTNWMNPNIDPCQWYGVSCQQYGPDTHVVVLNPWHDDVGDAGNFIECSPLPSSLGNFSRLITLQLTGNNGIHGPVPESLSSLKYLQDILLGGTSVGTLSASDDTLHFPEYLCEIDTLKRIDLSGAFFDGPIPDCIGNNLTNLEEFYYGYNNLLTGGIPASLGKLSSLRVLNLAANTLNGTIPTELSGCVSLEVLNIQDLQGDPPLTGEVPDIFYNMTNLSQVYIGGNQLYGLLPYSLISKTTLTDLWLSDPSAGLGNLFASTLDYLYDVAYSIHENDPNSYIHLGYNPWKCPLPLWISTLTNSVDPPYCDPCTNANTCQTCPQGCDWCETGGICADPIILAQCWTWGC